MRQFSNKTLAAVRTLIAGVDGCHSVVQDCDAGIVQKEWVDQRAGPCGDDFYGTVTWKLGDFYLIAHYAD